MDQSGASIAGATVNLFLPGGKTPVLSTKSSSDGIFDFNAVRPDTYRLEVKAPGFNDYAQNNIAIDPVRQTSLGPFKLEINPPRRPSRLQARLPPSTRVPWKYRTQ